LFILFKVAPRKLLLPKKLLLIPANKLILKIDARLLLVNVL